MNRLVICIVVLLFGCRSLRVAAEEVAADAAAPARGAAAVKVPEKVRAFLAGKPEYDKEWPPAFTLWRYEMSGGLASDSWTFGAGGMADALQIAASPATYRAFFCGEAAPDGAGQWIGKGIAWRLRDSRDLVADVIFATATPAADSKSAPRACVAVYTVADGKMIASVVVPLIQAETRIRIMKHFTYNRLTLLCEAAKMKRGFTVPDHVPLRLVLGVTAGAALPGGDFGVTMEIREGDHL